MEGEPFRLIVDTGSPYLVVPLERDCDAQPPKLSYYGCASPGQFQPAGLASTSEQYGALPGKMQWVRGDVSFGEVDVGVDADGRLSQLARFQNEVGGRLVLGAADRAVMSQSGGALLGLIARVNREAGSTIPSQDLRPTVLSQLGLSSFSLDAPRRALTLSTAPLLRPTADALKLSDPRVYGDGVEHICCRCEGDALSVNGVAYQSSRPLYCVFDSGLTGIVLSQSLVDELALGDLISATPPFNLAEVQARGRAKGGVASLSVALRTERNARVVLRADRGSRRAPNPLFYVQAIPLGWFSNAEEQRPHVVAVGQCVLGSGVLTVDSEERRAVWAPS